MAIKQKTNSTSIIPDERITGKIYYIRGKKVMFDRDLADLYNVETKVLNQAVKRNIKRFPDDFMFQLNKSEADIFLRFQNGSLDSSNSRSQIVTLKKDANLKSQFVTSSWGGVRKFSFVFTEQGVAMLSSVLNSDRAIQVNIQIMRTFTNLREMISTHNDLRNKIEKMEKENKDNFKIVFKVIAKLMATEPKGKELKIIGFEDRKK